MAESKKIKSLYDLDVVLRQISTFLEDSVVVVYGLRGLRSKAPKPMNNEHRIL